MFKTVLAFLIIKHPSMVVLEDEGEKSTSTPVWMKITCFF
jgi:hypothetical protein